MPALESKLIGIVVLAIVLLGLIGVVQVERAKNAQLTAQIQTAEETNKSDQTVIDGMKSALGEWQDAVAKASIAEATAKGVLEAQTAEHVQAAQKLTETEKKDDAIPGCADVLRVNLAAFCPGYVSAIRVRGAGSDLQGPPRPSPGAGSGTARH